MVSGLALVWKSRGFKELSVRRERKREEHNKVHTNLFLLVGMPSFPTVVLEGVHGVTVIHSTISFEGLV